MKRLLISCAFALPLFALATPTLVADVRTRDKTAIKFEGMLGRAMGLFGAGRAMRDGVVSTVAVKGNRKSTMNDASGQIVDLSEEKIYDLDVKKKTYTVTTFDELRQQMREAREKAEKEVEKEAEKEPGGQQQEPGEKGKEVEVDFDVKETGQKKQIAGYDTREVVMTVTVREKGKTLDQGGGLVLTANNWFGPEIPAMKDVIDFEMRYWKQLQGPDAGAMSPEQMAAVMAMYPLVGKAMERMKQEGPKLNGTVLATTTVFEAVKSKEAMAQQNEGSGGGGLGGMLARRLKKDSGNPRATFMTIQHETQEVATSVDAASLALPADFKEKK